MILPSVDLEFSEFMKLCKDKSNYVNIAGCDIFISDLRAVYKYRDLFIMRHNRIFAVHYSENAGFYATEIHALRKQPGELPYTIRGRYILVNRAELSYHCPKSDLILSKD